jgi:hypothetical protein
MDTHILWSIEGGTNHKTETNQVRMEHLLPFESGERNKSGDQNKPSECGTLTNCQVQMDGEVRTPKQTD